MAIKAAMCALTLQLLLGTAEAAAPKGNPLLIELPPETLATDVGAGGFVVVGGFFRVAP
jgi:hypothetical protein